ncbi:asparagine synthase (glutamine-hydrolysing) [Myxococcaceae bacterium]|nr:asparagine synthase (glutamine-hydrolysing) [Myxococcaceae bacterium]
MAEQACPAPFDRRSGEGSLVVCGFVGSFRPVQGRVVDDAVLARMRDRMSHRGPDGSGLWREPEGRCALAHRRLSIIDTSSAAAQPMANADSSVVLAFNGEIYNHAELRRELEAASPRPWRTDHSDTEVLLRAYEEWGLEGLHRLVGMFAFAIYDRRDPSAPVVHLVRDRAGVKPCYVAKTPAGEWLFGSEIRALVEHPHLEIALDDLALWHYLTFIVAPAPLTLFRGVFKIPSGCGVTIDSRGNARAWRWWDCRVDASDILRESDLSEEDATNELERLLRQSIARRMVSDVPFGVLLSGGVDSSLNVALMAELMERPVRTFTIGYRGEEESNEFRHAQRVRERFGTEHAERWIDASEVMGFIPKLIELQDEPIADNVCIPLYFLAGLVRESGCTVVQVGEGADELFLGYWWCQHYLEKEREVYAPARRGRSGLRGWLDERFSRWSAVSGEDAEIRRRARAGQALFWGGAVCWWGALRERLTPDPSAYHVETDCPVEGLLAESHRRLDSHSVVEEYLGPLRGRLPKPEILHEIPYLELKLRLPEHLLMRVDKMTMAHAVEARVPFLDADVIRFAMRLPPSYKLRDGVGKRIVKRVAERHLDPELVHRKKQGFGAPMERWFRDPDFSARTRAALERSELVKAGKLDGRVLFEMLESQRSGSGGHSFHLWTALNAVLWHERWVVGNLHCF